MRLLPREGQPQLPEGVGPYMVQPLLVGVADDVVLLFLLLLLLLLLLSLLLLLLLLFKACAHTYVYIYIATTEFGIFLYIVPDCANVPSCALPDACLSLHLPFLALVLWRL